MSDLSAAALAKVEAKPIGHGLEHRSRMVYIYEMNITLSPGQKKWLEAQVDAGHFSSVDDAVAVAVAELMAINYDDLAWAKPYVEEARTAVARGEVATLEDALTDIDTHVVTLKP